MDAPIPFIQPEETPVKRDVYNKFMLKSDPADANSNTYDFQVQHFKGGTPERTLIFFRHLNQVITGQGLTTGPQKFTVTRTLLKGEALRVFEQSTAATETNQTFKEA